MTKYNTLLVIRIDSTSDHDTVDNVKAIQAIIESNPKIKAKKFHTYPKKKEAVKYLKRMINLLEKPEPPECGCWGQGIPSIINAKQLQ